jgi:hypothetical protein
MMLAIFKFLEFLDFSQKIAIKMVCSVIFTYFVSQCVVRYLAKKTATGNQYGPIDETPFPEFSFCLKDRYKLGSRSACDAYVYGSNWNAPDGSNMTPGEYYR